MSNSNSVDSELYIISIEMSFDFKLDIDNITLILKIINATVIEITYNMNITGCNVYWFKNVTITSTSVLKINLFECKGDKDQKLITTFNTKLINEIINKIDNTTTLNVETSVILFVDQVPIPPSISIPYTTNNLLLTTTDDGVSKNTDDKVDETDDDDDIIVYILMIVGCIIICALFIINIFILFKYKFIQSNHKMIEKEMVVMNNNNNNNNKTNEEQKQNMDLAIDISKSDHDQIASESDGKEQNKTVVSIKKNNISFKIIQKQKKGEATKKEPDHDDDINDIRIWLSDKVGLLQYIDNFILNGYDSLDMIKEITHNDELKEIQINEQDHCNKILIEIQKLNGNNDEQVLTLEGVIDVV